MAKKKTPSWVQAPRGSTVGRAGRKSFPFDPKSPQGLNLLRNLTLKRLRCRYVTVIHGALPNQESDKTGKTGNTFWWNVPDVKGKKTFKQISRSYLKHFHKDFEEEHNTSKEKASRDVRDCRYVFPGGNSKNGRERRTNGQAKKITAKGPLGSPAQGIDAAHKSLFEEAEFVETGDPFDDIVKNFFTAPVDSHLLLKNREHLGLFFSSPPSEHTHEPIIVPDPEMDIDMDIDIEPERSPNPGKILVPAFAPAPAPAPGPDPDPDPDPDPETVPVTEPETVPEPDPPRASDIGNETMRTRLDKIITLLQVARASA